MSKTPNLKSKEAVVSGAATLSPSARIEVVEDGRTTEEVCADLAVEGVLSNAITTIGFSTANFGECDLTQASKALTKQINDAKSGNMGVADTLLIGQATALNAIFHEMARRASLNMGVNMEALDTYMRLGLKAQSQCRATLESLAKIKNPPNIAFVQQANIAHGPQQVNNGVQPGGDGAVGRVEKIETRPIELLEANNGEWMDTRATGTAGRGHPRMAALDEVNRPTDRKRKGSGVR